MSDDPLRKALSDGLQCDMFKTMKKNQQPGAQYVADSGWRRRVRLGIRSALASLPNNVTDFLYRQISGTLKRIGAPVNRQHISIFGNGRMSLDLQDGMQRSLYYSGSWEQNFTACLSRYLSEGSVFVDIGANIGYYTILAALRVGQTGHVYSFEPNPKAFSYLQENVALNRLNNVSLQNVALGDSNTTGHLKLCLGQLGLSRLITDNADDDDLVSVPIITLDAWLQGYDEQAPKVDVMKIDAEGAEMLILQGGHQLLSAASPPYLLVEVEDRWLQRMGSSGQQVLQYLSELGYRPYRVTNTGKFSPYDAAANQCHKDNLFFVPSGKPVL